MAEHVIKINGAPNSISKYLETYDEQKLMPVCKHCYWVLEKRG